MSLRKDIDKLEKPLLGILNKSFPFEEDWHMGQSGVPRSSLDAQVVFGHQQHGLTVKVDLVLGQTLRIVATYEGWIAGKKVHTGSKFFSGPPLPSLKGPEVSKWFTAETSKFRAALKKTYDYMGESKVQENTPNAQRLINEALSKKPINEMTYYSVVYYDRVGQHSQGRTHSNFKSAYREALSALKDPELNTPDTWYIGVEGSEEEFAIVKMTPEYMRHMKSLGSDAFGDDQNNTVIYMKAAAKSLSSGKPVVGRYV